jgi:V8-like Glu-specific endopeptidase
VLLKRRLSVVWAAAIMLLAVLLASGAALAITGGWPDNQEPYKYPNVGAMVDPGGFDGGTETLYTYCTGTLISPTVLLTAAHCYPLRGDGVTFAAKYVPGSSKVYSVCKGNWCDSKDYDGEFFDDPVIDIAVVVFDEPPLPGVTPARLPSLNRLNAVARDQKFTAVGYGDQATSFKESNEFTDQRMYAYSAYKSVNRTYLSLSQNLHKDNGGTCYGDSGGPNFFGKGTYQDGQPLTIAGTTITGDTWCKATNVTLRLDTKPVRDFLGGYGVTLPPEQPPVPEEPLVP